MVISTFAAYAAQFLLIGSCASMQGIFLSQMEHLACYFPGNLAQGVHEGAVTGPKAARYLDAARNLTDTCWHMYAKQPTGVSQVVFMMGPVKQRGSKLHCCFWLSQVLGCKQCIMPEASSAELPSA